MRVEQLTRQWLPRQRPSNRTVALNSGARPYPHGSAQLTWKGLTYSKAGTVGGVTINSEPLFSYFSQPF